MEMSPSLAATLFCCFQAGHVTISSIRPPHALYCLNVKELKKSLHFLIFKTIEDMKLKKPRIGM